MPRFSEWECLASFRDGSELPHELFDFSAIVSKILKRMARKKDFIILEASWL